ncbi:hypothetical protein [Streptomyces sp. CFMR 7]|uniref:hypothetical protein n=1 Tax=Streptomyces sp. CFMR 7 TaxID=1649184 RepID=UPI0011A92D39|nr:hypothetical protein [Streptomyces sp. CFMR 7]
MPYKPTVLYINRMYSCCGSCGKNQDPDARGCEHCGAQFAATCTQNTDVPAWLLRGMRPDLPAYECGEAPESLGG